MVLPGLDVNGVPHGLATCSDAISSGVFMGATKSLPVVLSNSNWASTSGLSVVVVVVVGVAVLEEEQEDIGVENCSRRGRGGDEHMGSCVDMNKKLQTERSEVLQHA